MLFVPWLFSLKQLKQKKNKYIAVTLSSEVNLLRQIECAQFTRIGKDFVTKTILAGFYAILPADSEYAFRIRPSPTFIL